MIGSFDRIGYLLHRRGFAPGDLDVDMSGRRCLVTGANAGLGRAIAHALAVRGATVELLCRDAGRGEAARDALRQATGSRTVSLSVLDVSDLTSVERYARDSAGGPVHVLVHNAGVLPDLRRLTADGMETTLATHVAGPQRLTHELLLRLRAARGARVIWVSSGGMYTQKLNLEDLDWTHRRYDGVTAYAQTKRMQVVLADQWAERLGSDGITVTSMHPGWADTGGVRTSLPRFHALTQRVLRTAEEGADTAVWLAVKNPAPGPGFWFDRTRRSAHYLPWTVETSPQRAELWALANSLARIPEATGRAVPRAGEGRP